MPFFMDKIDIYVVEQIYFFYFICIYWFLGFSSFVLCSIFLIIIHLKFYCAHMVLLKILLVPIIIKKFDFLQISNRSNYVKLCKTSILTSSVNPAYQIRSNTIKYKLCTKNSPNHSL